MQTTAVVNMVSALERFHNDTLQLEHANADTDNVTYKHKTLALSNCPLNVNPRQCNSSSEVKTLCTKYMTYMWDRKLLHHYNVNRNEHQFHDCS